MGLNRERPHLVILSEDAIYKDIATGFVGHFAVIGSNVRIEKEYGGWLKLVESFKNNEVSGLKKYIYRYLLLLLDFDEHSDRYKYVQNEIPSDVADRVFVLSCKGEAEDFKRNLGGGKTEKFGKKLSECCDSNTYTQNSSPWLCDQLKHNQDELKRLANSVRSWLFSR